MRRGSAEQCSLRSPSKAALRRRGVLPQMQLSQDNRKAVNQEDGAERERLCLTDPLHHDRRDRRDRRVCWLWETASALSADHVILTGCPSLLGAGRHAVRSGPPLPLMPLGPGVFKLVHGARSGQSAFFRGTFPSARVVWGSWRNKPHCWERRKERSHGETRRLWTCRESASW